MADHPDDKASDILTLSSTEVATSPHEDWRRWMKTAIRDPRELCRRLELPSKYAARAVRAAEKFPLFAPLGFIARMRPRDPHDPLLRQVLPLAEECDTMPGYSTDPVGDAAAQLAPGLIRKYASRALLVTTGACAVHCRYCFRREYPYDDLPQSEVDWGPALAALADDPTIDEILLSGGDPLTLVDRRLARLVERLAAIPHLRRLRIHTRLPIMIPQRVTAGLLDWLTGSRLSPLMVVHANHPAELDQAVLAALVRLVDAGVPVLNQAVLLRGVNDEADVLEALCRRLVDHRVMPYYLHQLDRVVGAAHFEVPVARGLALVEVLRTRLPGYAVPRYVQEIAGEGSKRVLA
jgi:EF-P beta-lysylation protein EpmB